MDYSVKLKLEAGDIERQLKKLQGTTSGLDQAVKKAQGSFEGLTGKLTKSGQEIRRTATGFEYFIDKAGRARKVTGQFVTTTEAAAHGVKKLRSELRRGFNLKGAGRGAAAGFGASGALSGIPGFAQISGGAVAGRLAGGSAAGAVAGGAAAGLVLIGTAATRSAGDVAKWNAELQRSRVALEAVSNGSAEYQESLRELQRISLRLNVPIGEATQQFTQLRAAMAATGFTGAESIKVFESLASANKALGGDSEKLQGILLASSQVFSKGKVAAEELRGQIGERLAGAFADFAKASGKSTAELDADLQRGEVSLEDFLAFAEYVGKKYGKTADKMAKDTSDAGARLTTAVEGWKQVIGPELSRLGGMFQDFATTAITSLTNVITYLGGVGTAIENKLAGGTALQNAEKNLKRLAELRKIPEGQRTAQQKKELKFLQNLEKINKATVAANAVKPPKPLDPRPDPEKDKEKDKEKKDKEKQLKDYTARNQAELASNQIALDRQIFDNQVALDNQRYELLRRLQQGLADLWAGQFTGTGRDQASLVTRLLEGQRGRADELRQLQQERARLEQDLKAAKAGVNIAQLRGQSSAIAAAGSLPQPIEYLTGDRSHSGYRADHGGSNYHEHIAYGSKSQRDQAMAILRANGIQIGSVNDGRHAPGSYHYSDQAFDVPASQVPVGQEEALSRRVRGLLGIGGGNIAPGGQANMSGVLGAQGSVEQVEAQITGLDERIKELTTDLQKFESLDIAAFVQDSTQSFREQTQSLTDQTEALQLRNRLQLEGVDPSVIEGELQKLQVNQELTQRVQVLDSALAEGKITQEQYAEAVGKLRENAEGAAGAIDKLTEATQAANNPINQRIGELRQQLGDTDTMIVSLSRSIESELGSAISNSISGLIDGTQTAEQAFSNMFKNIGKAFLDMAAQMLAQKLVLSILGAFAPGAAFGGGGFNLGGGGGLFASGGSLPWSSWSGGGYTGDGPRAGGVDGQGGFPAILHPQEQVIDHSRMGDAMARYNAGNRAGSGGGADGEGVAGGAGVGYEPQINVTTGPMLNFNGDQYVSRADFQAGLAQAAKQGAKMGEAQTMQRLKNSSAARRKIGI